MTYEYTLICKISAEEKDKNIILSPKTHLLNK